MLWLIFLSPVLHNNTMHNNDTSCDVEQNSNCRTLIFLTATWCCREPRPLRVPYAYFRNRYGCMSAIIPFLIQNENIHPAITEQFERDLDEKYQQYASKKMHMH
jgi:hypothetical protein